MEIRKPARKAPPVGPIANSTARKGYDSIYAARAWEFNIGGRGFFPFGSSLRPITVRITHSIAERVDSQGVHRHSPQLPERSSIGARKLWQSPLRPRCCLAATRTTGDSDLASLRPTQRGRCSRLNGIQHGIKSLARTIDEDPSSILSVRDEGESVQGEAKKVNRTPQLPQYAEEK